MIYDPGKGGGTRFRMAKHTVCFTCAYTHLLVKHAWHDVMGVQVFISMKKKSQRVETAFLHHDLVFCSGFAVFDDGKWNMNAHGQVEKLRQGAASLSLCLHQCGCGCDYGCVGGFD